MSFKQPSADPACMVSATSNCICNCARNRPLLAREKQALPVLATENSSWPVRSHRPEEATVTESDNAGQ